MTNKYLFDKITLVKSMHIIGIVVEYNPIHNGHIYQINKIKEMYPESILIVAMSGNFTQRGNVSIINKWDKTKLALENNIDIVLEIPFIFTNQSSDTFSYASIKLLNELKIDTLVFGSESNDLDSLIKASKIQINNSEFDELVKKYIINGYNYPTSISKSIKDLTNINIKESNDLLGVSYIKEIIKNNYNITPVSIKRTNNYLDILSNDDIISADNIRNKLSNNIDISKYIPKNTINYIKRIDKDKLFNLIKYKIIVEKDNLINYHLVSEGIEKRLYKEAIKTNNLDDLINNIKTKRYTYNRINRILINILLGITKEDIKNNNLDYVRVLGMSNKGKEYINKIKKDINLPIITKFTNNKMLNIELKASLVYGLLINEDEYTKEIKNHVIIK